MSETHGLIARLYVGRDGVDGRSFLWRLVLCWRKRGQTKGLRWHHYTEAYWCYQKRESACGAARRWAKRLGAEIVEERITGHAMPTFAPECPWDDEDTQGVPSDSPGTQAAPASKG